VESFLKERHGEVKRGTVERLGECQDLNQGVAGEVCRPVPLTPFLLSVRSASLDDGASWPESPWFAVYGHLSVKWCLMPPRLLLRPGLQDEIEGGCGGAPESGEAAFFDHVSQARFPGLLVPAGPQPTTSSAHFPALEQIRFAQHSLLFWQGSSVSLHATHVVSPLRNTRNRPGQHVL
jgi:hypothetical protein